MADRVDIERLRALPIGNTDTHVTLTLPEFHAILAELQRGRRIEVALVKAMDTLDDFAAYASMCGRPPLANAARIAVDASLAALEQENGNG